MKNFHFNPFRSRPPSCCRLLNNMYHRKSDKKTNFLMFLPHVTIGTSQFQPIVLASSCQSIVSNLFFHISVEKNNVAQQLDTLQHPFHLDFQVPITHACAYVFVCSFIFEEIWPKSCVLTILQLPDSLGTQTKNQPYFPLHVISKRFKNSLY